MGSTPIHGIPFADPTDLVRDWPALSEDVALAIEAALEDISVPQKRIEAFTGSGTWTVPAGVTYAIAHVLGGGGGGGGQSTTGGAGGFSRVAFASGNLDSAGGRASAITGSGTESPAPAGPANTGQGGVSNNRLSGEQSFGGDSKFIVGGAAVTPAASIAITVGAGGTAGSGARAGSTGYVFIEYFEEV